MKTKKPVKFSTVILYVVTAVVWTVLALVRILQEADMPVLSTVVAVVWWLATLKWYLVWRGQQKKENDPQ